MWTHTVSWLSPHYLITSRIYDLAKPSLFILFHSEPFSDPLIFFHIFYVDQTRLEATQILALLPVSWTTFWHIPWVLTAWVSYCDAGAHTLYWQASLWEGSTRYLIKALKVHSPYQSVTWSSWRCGDSRGKKRNPHYGLLPPLQARGKACLHVNRQQTHPEDLFSRREAEPIWSVYS